MKKNTYFLKIYSILLLMMVLIACGEEDKARIEEEFPIMEPDIVLSPNKDILFEQDGGNREIKIYTNVALEDITVSVDNAGKDWCSANLNKNIITLKALNNVQEKDREAVISVNTLSVTRTVKIKQKAKTVIYPEITKTYKVDIPTLLNFNISKIYKIIDKDIQLGEICMEYLKSNNISSRAIVVYLKKGESIDYSNGYVAFLLDNVGNISQKEINGGKAKFNNKTGLLTYTSGSDKAIQTIYISPFGLSKDYSGETTAAIATYTAYTVRDIENNVYPVVKIGSDVWLASNLRTTKFEDGSSIDLISSNKIVNYKTSIPFATYPAQKSDIDVNTYGLLYNKAVVENESKIKSMIIDGKWRLATGGGSNISGLNATNSDWQRLFNYIGENELGTLLSVGYTWGGGGSGGFNPSTVSNLTGLSLVPAGELYAISRDVEGETTPNYTYSFGTHAFMFYGEDEPGSGYNLAEVDGKAPDQVGIRIWNHSTDACSIRLVRESL